MKGVNKIHTKMPTKKLDDEIFWNEELWEGEHVLDDTHHTVGSWTPKIKDIT